MRYSHGHLPYLLLFSVLSAVMGCGGGIPVDLQLGLKRNTLNSLQQAIDEFGNAITSLETEGELWRQHLDKLNSDLADNAHNIIVKDLRQYTDETIAKLGGELRCNLTFAERLVKANLQLAKGSLEAAREKVEQAENPTDSVIEQILGDLAFKAAPLDPFVCSFNPDVVHIEYSDHETYSHRERVIQVHGFGFTEANLKNLTVKVHRGDRYLPLAGISIKRVTDFQLQLDLGQVTFVRICGSEIDHGVALSWGENLDQNELTVSWPSCDDIPDPPPPPTPARKLVRIRMEAYTTENDLDYHSQLNFYVVKDGYDVPKDSIDSRYVVGGPLTKGFEQVWSDKDRGDDLGERNEFTFALKKGIPESDVHRHHFVVIYGSTKGDPNWIGRVTVWGQFDRGKTEEVLLPETGDFELGEHDNFRHRNKVWRGFPLRPPASTQ